MGIKEGINLAPTGLVWKEANVNIEHERHLAAEKPEEDWALDINDWFGLAWNREIPRLKHMPPGPTLNLGAGYRQWEAASVDREHGYNLDAGNLASVAPPGSISGIWAHGVFEHLQRPVQVLLDCQRLLVPGGVLNIVVPHGASFLQLEDLDHKHAFTEETWRNLFENPYYQATGEAWELTVHACFIIGVAWRNLALFTQFVKAD